MVSDLPRAGLVDRCQLDQIDWRPTCDRIVEVRASRLSRSVIFLQLDHKVLRSNRGTMVPLALESNGTSKASKSMSSKEQISLVRDKECSVFEQLIVRLTDFCEVSSEPKN